MDENKIKQGFLQKVYPYETKRYCQFLCLKPEKENLAEYKYWHKNENIWKEIPDGIRRVGILNMEIYLIENMAFMIVETPVNFNWDEAFGILANYERQAEWEAFVSKYQIANSGQVSSEKWQLMDRIFTLPEVDKVEC